MRRQTQPHGLAARWCVDFLDIDPRDLPVRYTLPVGVGHARDAHDLIEINPDIVTVEHQVAGVPPVRRYFAFQDFAGIAIRMESLDASNDRFVVSVNLHHADPKLCFPLYLSHDMDSVCARWQCWGRAFKLPLLLPDSEGGWREPVRRFGQLKVNAPCSRPARLVLAARRSCISSIRETGNAGLMQPVQGAELIARS